MSTSNNGIVVMPTTPKFVSSDWSLVRTIGATVSPFTGHHRTQEFSNVYWTASVTLPPMNRTQSLEWQTFLSECKGPINSFLFADPDHETNSGTFDGTVLKAENRINDTNVTLSFSSNTITAGTAIFGSAIVGDYIHVTGATNEINNGTHKISSITSNSIVVVATDLTTESNTASCKVRQNVAGAEALSLNKNSGSHTGTIKKGDYLALHSGINTNHKPFQLVMCMEDVTFNGEDASVKIQPRLRQDFATNFRAKFASPQGLFRLTSNEINWKTGVTKIYEGMTFSVIEDIGAPNS